MENEGITKTCLRIDMETWKKFKIQCITQGCSANETLNKLIEKYIRQTEELDNGKRNKIKHT